MIFSAVMCFFHFESYRILGHHYGKCQIKSNK